MADTASATQKSDLGIRVLSAIVMLAVAGTALWMAGTAFIIFVVLIGLGLLWEWSQLALRFAQSAPAKFLWLIAGALYIAFACFALIAMPGPLRLLAIVTVIAVDTGAYFAGRRFGNKKIAPSISPSKTWAGLYGGMAGAGLVMVLTWLLIASAISAFASKPQSPGAIMTEHPLALLAAIGLGALLAILAQAGDFFESWMKRRAGVKDSGKLIPGHGGLFDRVDGLLPVSIAFWLLSRVTL
ncbi:MAG: phosphatidate cytidylyltransferase [Sphingobium sp.]|nr:phosphatidate cytidylyltransferase [Sphingobium sp.]MCP5398850.1 phosphatidate cytidylyltransferase [Sphingomonas sp.]